MSVVHLLTKDNIIIVQQQQQLKKLGIIIYYLDQFNHNRIKGVFIRLA